VAQARNACRRGHIWTIKIGRRSRRRSLARLDAALVRADVTVARESLDVIGAPLRLFVETSKTLTFSPSVIGQTLSSAAYDLGSLALESTPALPDGLSAVLADARGTLDYIDRGAQLLAAMSTPKTSEAFGVVMSDSAVLRKRIDAAMLSHVFEERASFVLLTGKLGASLRRLSMAVGIDARPPYRPRTKLRRTKTKKIYLLLPFPRETLLMTIHKPWRTWTLVASYFSTNAFRLEARGHALRATFLKRVWPMEQSDPSRSTRPSRCATPRRCCTDRFKLLTCGTVECSRPNVKRLASFMRKLRWVLRTMTSSEHSNVLTICVRSLPQLVRRRSRPMSLGRALAPFQAHEFVPADAPIDRYARGDESALSPDARAGLDVFAGRGRCARCHVPPFFGGSRPRDFTVPIFAVLGVPTKPRGTTIDPDLGRGSVTHRDVDAFAFKTPTVRNVLRTAPYFHHGAFRTLEQVVDFYDLGGGRGLRLSVPNQDPDVRKLDLSPREKAVLLEFLRVGLLDATPPDKLVLKRIAGN
jgi:cytochrome c peroxidase